ncbi:hypothetical protein NsoK4_08875 [Nitrosopumilus sp. K4]|uniref:DapH/DapD/GlmU-related protein n=1 Tax=Nitrosopumilus sp. K4 TaxID=2795383 RepID=UPI001BAB4AF7|nr:DapH/DapD/GlmU-related protein [Nitrosopumilus sp. K4]QUC64520.1 hypothetical protein NsoK4_08875 [Nitrosopumilus sp. K4]
MLENYIVKKGAKIGKNVSIGHNSLIYSDVIIQENTRIGPNCIIGHPSKATILNSKKLDPKLQKRLLTSKTVIGKNSIIRSGTIIYSNVKLGNNCNTGHNAVIREHTKIGNNCIIGTNVVLNGFTKIGNFTRINTTCALPQSTIIGKGVFLAPLVAFSDNKNVVMGNGNEAPIIKDYVRLGVGTIVLPNITIGRGSLVGSGSVVTKDIPSMSICYGNPAIIKSKISKNELIKYKMSVEH